MAGVGRERTYANGIQNLVCDVVNELAARLGRLYELTKLASAAVKAEALGYSPRVIERSLLVPLEHVSLPVRCSRTSPYVQLSNSRADQFLPRSMSETMRSTAAARIR